MQDYKIGYTNGVFDLLHVGHLEFLKAAKEKCGHLIVAVCEDELAYKYKGKYPIIPLKDRMKLLSGIKYVDQVVIQSTTDRISEWERYHFNVIFHGIDGQEWDKKNGYFDSLNKLGVKSIYFERPINISTTQIINTILSRYSK